METELEKAARESTELRGHIAAFEHTLRTEGFTVKCPDGISITYPSRSEMYETYGVLKFKLLEAQRRRLELLFGENVGSTDVGGTTCHGIYAGTSWIGFRPHLLKVGNVVGGGAPKNAGGGSPKFDPEGGIGKSETAAFDTDWMKIPEEDVCRFRIPGMKTTANTGTIEGTELGWKVTVDDFEFLAEVELPVKATLKKVSSTVGDEDFVTAIYLETPSGERIQILDEPHSKIEQEFHDAFSEHLARFMEAPEFNAAFHLWKEKAACFERGRQFQRMVA